MLTKSEKKALAVKLAQELTVMSCAILNAISEDADIREEARGTIRENLGCGDVGYSISAPTLEPLLRDACPRCDGDSDDGDICEDCRAETAIAVIDALLGFEEHQCELALFEASYHARHQTERQKHLEARATALGCSVALVELIERLERRIETLENRE